MSSSDPRNWDAHPSSEWNPVVVDVHTDSRDTVCAGDPVMSHHESLTERAIRLNDHQWLQTLEAGQEPAFETWKHDFLVPE